jgi:hypothetical protein
VEKAKEEQKVKEVEKPATEENLKKPWKDTKLVRTCANGVKTVCEFVNVKQQKQPPQQQQQKQKQPRQNLVSIKIENAMEKTSAKGGGIHFHISI